MQPLFYAAALVIIAILLVLPFVDAVEAAEAGQVAPDKPAEYIIYQYPGVALLIRIDAVEIEFESRVYGSERSLIKASRIPARRVGPVYQFIEAIDTARQLIVEVIPAVRTDRSRISMELVQLPQDERNSVMQSEAFRALSLAVDSTSANDSTTWAMKVYALEKAANSFERLGWEELRLWSEHYAAHLLYFKLGDDLSAIELSREVKAAARKAGFAVIEMATLQLEGTILLNTTKLLPGLPPQQKFSETHRVLERASILAEELGFQSERALALFNDGVAWEQEENLTQALQQYRKSLDIAQAAGDDELANDIRNKAAFAYEAQGSVSGAIEMLDQIGNELSDGSAALELAQNLLEKGRILSASYRYPEAVEVLQQAYDLQESNGALSQLGRTGLELGHAFYNLGQMDQAAEVLQNAIARTSATGHEQGLRNAWGVLATVYRSQGDYAAMSVARDRQAAYVNSELWRARHTYERALDSRVSSGQSSTAALRLLRQSNELARSSGDVFLRYRAQLAMCSYAAGESSSSQACSPNQLRQAFDFLLAEGIPRYALEARLAYSTILRNQGRLKQAITGMNQLVDEISFYRSTLQGVVGGWYWENRERIFAEYMAMILRESTVDDKITERVLVALESLRSIGRIDSMNLKHDATGASDGDSIRSALAALEESANSSSFVSLTKQVKERIGRSKAEFRASKARLGSEELMVLLDRLPKNAVLLTFYFSTSDVHAILADRFAVRVIKLASGKEINSGLNVLRQNLERGDVTDLTALDKLGRLLLQPLAKLIPEYIYFVPDGPLNGFPLDLLRLEGDFLAEKHLVLNLQSVMALEEPFAQVDTESIELFFLAGDPEARRDVFDYQQTMSPEIRAVTDVFVGPALHIVQGTALKRDEFQDERFERANVIHLAVPGTISLENPAQSTLVLSGSGTIAGGESMWPADFQQRKFEASLAVLSAVRIQGLAAVGINNYLGFVSDFLSSGVKSVVASLWASEEHQRTRFMASFYQNLARDPDVASALFKTKRQFCRSQILKAVVFGLDFRFTFIDGCAVKSCLNDFQTSKWTGFVQLNHNFGIERRIIHWISRNI